MSVADTLAHSLVVYLVRKQGGLDTIRQLARAYTKYQNMVKALRKELGVSYTEFDPGWQAWLKQLFQ